MDSHGKMILTEENVKTREKPVSLPEQSRVTVVAKLFADEIFKRKA
jgi:hypothetical protein